MAKAKDGNRADAIALLKADHRKVEELFKRYEKSKNEGVKGKLAKRFVLNCLCTRQLKKKSSTRP